MELAIILPCVFVGLNSVLIVFECLEAKKRREEEKEKEMLYEKNREPTERILSRYKTHIEKYLLSSEDEKDISLSIQMKRCTKYTNKIQNTVNGLILINDTLCYYSICHYFIRKNFPIIYREPHYEKSIEYCIYLFNEDMLVEKYTKYNEIFQLLCFSYTGQLKIPWDLIRLMSSYF